MKKFIKYILRNNRIKGILYALHNLIFCRIRNRGHKNVIKINSAYLHKVKIIIRGNYNMIKISKDSRLFNTLLYINGNDHKLIINDKCTIKGGSLWFEDNMNQIYIDSKTTIESAHLAVTGVNKIISLGKDCMLSQKIEIRTGDSHSIIDKTTGSRINYEKDVAIGNHVWIGANVIILKGVTIHDNVIIGTGSLVTKSIQEADCIIGGTPAKILKRNVNWERNRI
jgi:acetyltransferase-like isoleucine patch superfamily enzyme